MSPNNAPQNQDAGSQATSQEPANKPYMARLKTTGKAISSLLRRCWGQLKAGLSIICWEATNILEYIFGVLAEVRVPIVLWVLFVFLHKPIEEFAIKRLVAPVLAHFDTGIVPSSTMLGLALCFTFYTLLLCLRRYVIGGKWLLTALLVLLGYCYYRCTPHGLEAIAPFRFALLFDGAWPSYLTSRVAILQPQQWAFADIIPFTCILLLLVWGSRYVCLRIKQLAQIRRCSWTSIRDRITSWVEKLKKRYAPFVREQTWKQAHKVKGFLTDHPLTEEEEALSGWTSQAQTLTQKLLATDTTRAAFSLGIVASWGEGKSSFMGIMQRYLQQAQREVIVMHFNPWLYDKEAQLTKVFFEELRRTLAPYSSKLSKSIDNYADLLLAVDSSWLKLAHELLRLSQRSTTEQFDKLSRDIKELGRKVVIFIDDVDRLTREELLELFKLVRNSSNLPCLYFVLAYDKSYVLKTLQSEGEHMSRYPEKIFQEEYPLPNLPSDKMWTVLERCLNETALWEKDGEKASKLLAQLKDEEVNLSYHLTTLRKVKRMVNAFGSRYELLRKAGVAPFDLFIFELIYYVYPTVYDFLLEKHKDALARLRSASREESAPHPEHSIPSFFFIHSNYRKIDYISLNPESEEFKGIDWGSGTTVQKVSDVKDSADRARQSVIDTLKELSFELEHEHKKDIVASRVADLLLLLWGGKREPKSGQINFKTYWGRYFYRGLQSGDLSREEFNQLCAEPDLGKRRELLESWNYRQCLAFRQEVLDYTPKGLQDMEAVLYAMFDWNSLGGAMGMIFNSTEIDELIQRKVKDRCVGDPSPEEIATKLLEILDDELIRKAAFYYTSSHLMGKESGNPFLSEDALIRKQVDIFIKVAEQNIPIKELYNSWWLWCGLREDRGIKRASEIDQLMRERIEKDIEGFLEAALHQSDYDTYKLLDIPWKNLTEFDGYLSKYTDKPYVVNFREFLSIAINRAQEVGTAAPITIKIKPGEWERMPSPNFDPIIILGPNENLHSPSAPLEGKQA